MGGDGEGERLCGIVRLLLLTGCRCEEIGGLGWQEVEGHAITLGKGRTKTGVVHEVPLTKSAWGQLPEHAAGREFVFGKGEGFSGWSKAKSRLDAAVGFEWRLHDLRRTISTRLNEAGVDPHVVEALLGHAGARRGSLGSTIKRHTGTRNGRRWRSGRGSLAGSPTYNNATNTKEKT